MHIHVYYICPYPHTSTIYRHPTPTDEGVSRMRAATVSHPSSRVRQYTHTHSSIPLFVLHKRPRATDTEGIHTGADFEAFGAGCISIR